MRKYTLDLDFCRDAIEHMVVVVRTVAAGGYVISIFQDSAKFWPCFLGSTGMLFVMVALTWLKRKL